MAHHHKLNFHSLRGMHRLFTLLALLVCASIVAGGSIPSSHKHPAPQQQIVVQQQQQQQQQHQQPHQLQQQQPAELHQSIQQDSNRVHMRPHEHQERMSAPTTIASGSSDTPNAAEYLMKDVGVDDEINEPYHYLSDLKVEPRLTAESGMPWNPYFTPNQGFAQTPTMPAMLGSWPYNSHSPFGSALPPLMTPRLMPFFSYPQPILVPLPMYFAPTGLLYPGYAATGNEIDESMSRAVADQGAQSSHFDHTPSTGSGATARNSQIYFMRFAPMPYMFMPGVGFPPNQQTLPALQSYAPLPALPAISPILNIPLNFVANGRPSSIYQMGGAPNDFPSSVQFNNVNPFGMRPPAAMSSGFSLVGANRPTVSGVGSGFSSHGSYGMTSLPPSNPHSLQQDSKMTLLKRPFYFNGRPDEIYTLPNNFNPLYSNSGYY